MVEFLLDSKWSIFTTIFLQPSFTMNCASVWYRHSQPARLSPKWHGCFGWREVEPNSEYDSTISSIWHRRSLVEIFYEQMWQTISEPVHWVWIHVAWKGGRLPPLWFHWFGTVPNALFCLPSEPNSSNCSPQNVSGVPAEIEWDMKIDFRIKISTEERTLLVQILLPEFPNDTRKRKSFWCGTYVKITCFSRWNGITPLRWSQIIKFALDDFGCPGTTELTEINHKITKLFFYLCRLQINDVPSFKNVSIDISVKPISQYSSLLENCTATQTRSSSTDSIFVWKEKNCEIEWNS